MWSDFSINAAGEKRPSMPVTERLCYSPAEAAKALSIGRTKVYELLHAKDPIPHVRIGGSVRIPAEALRAWIEERTAKAGAAA
jgi:excisionase family DNA binding protein